MSKTSKDFVKPCIRCGHKFRYNPLIHGDDVCPTCDRMNDITFWYPRLLRLGFPMPKTIIIHTNCHLESLAYDKEPEGLGEFIKDIERAAKKIGMPVFLKTGYTSNKHDWKDSCYITDLKKLKDHIQNLVGFSAIATIDRFMPCDFWAVREMIPTKPYFTAFHGEMPITKERRIFVRDGKVVCSHSYWPEEAFKGVEKKKFDQLDVLTIKDKKELIQMASYVAKLFSGYWSCDFLKSKKGDWYLTDMAIGENSYHAKHKKKK